MFWDVFAFDLALLLSLSAFYDVFPLLPVLGAAFGVFIVTLHYHILELRVVAVPKPMLIMDAIKYFYVDSVVT